ncbi:TnsA endonuclease N-terminal domain-containing protein [Paraclostridium bifermentans]|uniref:TnsA endonuclease N-terminal domain-containing protein n=1 Tax=Paraclostridium bifermentans TaxID=1490 RepID=UPI00242ACBB0|nr:TnsA endonuclease N-terminal domain-containing protein [Paraclostridium bifermentans]
MSKVKKVELNQFALYKELLSFYNANKGKVKMHYKYLTKKFLEYNNPDNGTAFLRKPQYEALEIYVFLKEFLNNKQMHNIFEDWYSEKEEFETKHSYTTTDKNGQVCIQIGLAKLLAEREYKSLFEEIKKNATIYPNYIFALTMGTGKTILMATCIFYEFLLSNKFPKDKNYCHNALVFAPDKTVLHSLKEIQTFDKSLVVPPEYVSFLDAHIRFHFLEEDGVTLNTIDKSKFNIIISNNQKIILKEQHKEKTPIQKFYELPSSKVLNIDISNKINKLGIYDFNKSEDFGDTIDSKNKNLTQNQRFEKLTRLEQIGIYVDEAHHMFGNKLKDSLSGEKDSSLRRTINILAHKLKNSGTSVVSCYNYTGTPYIGKQILSEVVYAYGLKEAIQNKYLKKVNINSYKNVKTEDFIRDVVTDFWEKYGNKTYEGLKPKLAIYASNTTELEKELKPILENVLIDLDIPLDSILINTGDNKQTSDDDIREFKSLDKKRSSKQFILLVNKGKEGWNCRSLFGVALFRTPSKTNKIFVLQSTMRCLRSIGNIQETASVYLSKDNYDILENELQQNFNISIEDINTKKIKEKEEYEVRPVPPPRKIKVKSIKHEYDIIKKEISKDLCFELDKIDLEKYTSTKTIIKGFAGEGKSKQEQNLLNIKKRKFTRLTIVAEISRYMNESCILIYRILDISHEGIEEVLSIVNKYNDILYDVIIPKIFNELNEIKVTNIETEKEIELVKVDSDKVFNIRSEKELAVSMYQTEYSNYRDKSFHLDTYCFDSGSEKRFFIDMLMDGTIKEIYFTGMLIHGQSDFYIQYLDPETRTVRSYYPDFLMKTDDNMWEIIEIKGDNKIDDKVVNAKKLYATELATASNMKYEIIKSSQIDNGTYRQGYSIL